MLKTRLIPVLLLKDGLLVRSELFREHQVIGNPVNEVQRLNEWNVDELIYLDITRGTTYDQRRDDQKIRSLGGPLEILQAVSKTCFMPLTWGGRIKSVQDMALYLSSGADKVAINSEAFRRPELIREGSRSFGSQAIVVSIDVLRHADGRAEVFIGGGQEPTGCSPEDWARRAEEHGAGEILLQSIHRDGTGGGYDLELIRNVAAVTSIPVIACSGVGRYEDYAAGVRAGAAAVAAANIWHFKELADRRGKQALAKAGVDVRL